MLFKQLFNISAQSFLSQGIPRMLQKFPNIQMGLPRKMVVFLLSCTSSLNSAFAIRHVLQWVAMEDILEAK